jgi:hypothetical protein
MVTDGIHGHAYDQRDKNHFEDMNDLTEKSRHAKYFGFPLFVVISQK